MEFESDRWEGLGGKRERLFPSGLGGFSIPCPSLIEGKVWGENYIS